jgi:serine/threonine-protein kinase
MAEAHGVGIVHRDLKPSNLFLANDGGMRIVKALDFGISKVSNDRDVKITDAHAVMGTALYMSPEQVKASHSVDARTDIWALGIILYEAIAGRAPFMGTPTQVAAAIVTEDALDVRTYAPSPPELSAVVNKTLQREPSNRFSDVRQLAVALAPFAPPGSIGRLYAESLIGTESGNFGSLAAPPPSSGHLPTGPDSAPTVMNLAPPPYESGGSAGSLAPQASARSESAMRPDGTAPGWSQHGEETKRKNRALLLAAGIAFVVALLAIGGGVYALSAKRFAPSDARSATEPPVAADPVPPSLDPLSQPSAAAAQATAEAPPVTSAAAATAAPAKVTTTKPVAAPKPAAAPATGRPPTAAPASSVPKDKDGKPLFL